MLGNGVIGYTQHRLERVWSSRLSEPLRPASSGPLRHYGCRSSEVLADAWPGWAVEAAADRKAAKSWDNQRIPG
jgi:hypothetical protein